MSYQSLKNGKVITWPDLNDIQGINTDLLQLKNDLDALKSKVSTEAEQQDSYYGRNIKTITEQVGSSTLSPYLDDTNAQLMSALAANAKTFYVENIQGLHINCNYFISNAATCDEILVTDITTDFNNYDSSEDSIYKINVKNKIPNDYAINKASVIRTNMPTRNNKAYDAYDTLTNDVDTFFMESTLATLQIPNQIGLYNTTKATSNSDNILDYSLDCYQDMPRLTLNRFVDVGHIVDPDNEKQLKFSGTTTIDNFKFDVYVKTFACTYNGNDYDGISGRTQQNVSRTDATVMNNFDPFLVLRQNIGEATNSNNIKYFFTDYRTVDPPKGTTAWTDTTGSLVDLDMIPGNASYIFNHAEFLTVSYTRRVIAGTTNPPTSSTPDEDIEIQTIPFGDYDKITVQLSSPLSNSEASNNKIFYDKSKTLYINKQFYSGITFYYNNDQNDVVTRTASDPVIVQDNYKAVGTIYSLVFETVQEAVGKKAYRLYVNSNLTSENFVKHGDTIEYNSAATNTNQFMNGISVRVVPSSSMLYGDQPYGTIYTRPITLSGEAISKFSLYCSLYRNDLTSILQESVDTDTNEKITEFFLNTYVSFDTRIKKRKNINLYPKVPCLYSGAHYHHGQRRRADATETTAKDGTNGACFIWDAASWRPFTYKKQEAHPEQMSLDTSRSDWECLLDYVIVRIEQQNGSSTVTLVTITVYPKSMTVKCSTSSGITVNQTATVPTGITKTSTDNINATYTINSNSNLTFLQTYQQANDYNDHRYYYQLVYNTTGIKVIKSTTNNRCTITFSHISTATTQYSYTSITPYVKYAIPLYLFGRISDVGTAQVMLDGVQTSIMPLINVISPSIILTLMRNGEPYEYSSLVYTPRATTTFLAPGTVSGTLTLTFTEKDDTDKIDNKTVVQFTIDSGNTKVTGVSVKETTITTSETTFNPTGTISGTASDKKVTLSTISTGSRKIDIVVTLSTSTSSSVTTTITTLTETISYESMTFIKTFTDTQKTNAAATLVVQFQKKYKGMPIPRVAAYDNSNQEVPNWFFFNGYNYKSDNRVDKSLRLNGIVMATVLPPNVEVISSYDYYEDVCQQENWIPMKLEPNLMHVDDAFSKTTSSYVLSQDNLQSAKCKIQITSSSKMQYFIFSCKTIAKTQIYVDNDNLENQNALKIPGQKTASRAYLADSIQRLAGKAMVESPFAGEEISFLAKVAAIYSIPRIQNAITGKWEIPPRANRVLKGSLKEAVLNAGYYVAIEEYITPPKRNTTGDNTYEINCLTTTGSDKVAATIDYVHSWGAYFAGTACVKILPLRTMSEIDSPTNDVKTNGGYFWDPDRLQLTVYPPKNQNLSSNQYIRHLIPYSKAQAFITAMQNPKYYCFQPTLTATESVWEAKDSNGEFILDFEPIIAVQSDKVSSQIPRCLGKSYNQTADYKTVAVCMTWQDIPNISGMNLAWTTKALNIQVEEEETGEE